MADQISEAKVERFKKIMRELFLKQFKRAIGEDEEKLIDSAAQSYRRGLALEKARRAKKRRKHDSTADMFNTRE